MVNTGRVTLLVKDILNSPFVRAVVRVILQVLIPFVNSMSAMLLYKPNIFVQNGKKPNVLNENYSENAIIAQV
jgi:hypothetical protein